MSAKCQKQTFSHPQKETPCSRFPNRTGLILADKYAQPYQSALVPWIVQAVETFATARLEETVPPFIVQIATLPLVSRQRMSLLPSPLKSPVSTIDQLVGTFATNTLEETVPSLTCGLPRGYSLPFHEPFALVPRSMQKYDRDKIFDVLRNAF
jgi:hypothetical protein